jgi:hypothetical protein
MKLFRTVFFSLALAGCGPLGVLFDDRPNDTQQDAIGDSIDQAVTIATTLDDPASATDADLLQIMTFDHWVFLVEPDLASGGSARRAAPIQLDETCFTDDGVGRVDIDGCQVALGDGGAVCVVVGGFNYQIGDSASTFDGGASIEGEGCPVRDLSFAIDLEGPLDDPSAVTGSIQMTDVSGGDTDVTIDATISLSRADGCDVPSEGTIEAHVSGDYNGTPVDGDVTVAFHSSPECGYLSLE